MACGGITNACVEDGDGEADDGDGAALGEDAADVGETALVVAAALADAWASAAFLALTAVMLEKNRDAARATPTINVMTGVGILMPVVRSRLPGRFNGYPENLRNPRQGRRAVWSHSWTHWRQRTRAR